MTQLSLASALIDTGKSSATAVAKPSSQDGRQAGKSADTEFADVMDAANASSGETDSRYETSPDDSSKELQKTDQQQLDEADLAVDDPVHSDTDAIQEPEVIETSLDVVDPTVATFDASIVALSEAAPGVANAGTMAPDPNAELNSLHGVSPKMAAEVGEVTPHALTTPEKVAHELANLGQVRATPADVQPSVAQITGQQILNAGDKIAANGSTSATAVSVQTALSQSEPMLDPPVVVNAAQPSATSSIPSPNAIATLATSQAAAPIAPTMLQKHAVDVSVGEERALMRAEADVEAVKTQTAQAAVNTATAAAPTASNAATTAQFAPVQAVVQSAQQKEQQSSLKEADLEVAHIELRGGSSQSASGPSPAAAPPQPGLARHIAFQIADAMRATPDQAVELALSPKELGSVRLTISAADGNVVLQVVAERPETLDLMRRNSDGLLRDLADLGFTSIDLAFGQGGSADADASDDSSDDAPADGTVLASGDETSNTIDTAAVAIQLDGAGGLDIRI